MTDLNKPAPDGDGSYQNPPPVQGGQQPSWNPPPQNYPPQDQPPQNYPPQNYPAPNDPSAYGGLPPAPPANYPAVPYDARPPLALPEGVVLASHGRRIGAWFLSFVLAIVTLGIGYVIWGLIVWSKGTSPALQVLGMKVWSVDEHRPASFGRMALRDIVGRILESILSLLTALASFVCFLATQRRQSICDLIGSTVVVYDPHKVLR